MNMHLNIQIPSNLSLTTRFKNSQAFTSCRTSHRYSSAEPATCGRTQISVLYLKPVLMEAVSRLSRPVHLMAFSASLVLLSLSSPSLSSPPLSLPSLSSPSS